MKDTEILRKAIDKAEKNGFRLNKNHHVVIGHDDLTGIKWLEMQDIIWQHDFAKAFFIAPELGVFMKTKAGENYSTLYWKKKLQEMVLEEDPIRYLEKFL